jgi:hypothetical protein
MTTAPDAKAAPNPLTFLLGCERSGSTWLANILDAHEAVELLMEPFAPYARLFPEFPERNQHVPHAPPELAQAVRRGLGGLLAKKYSLCYRPGRGLAWKSVDARLATTIRAGHQLLRLTPPLRLRQWELLNLNTSELPVSLQTRKRWPPRHTVLKELRLNLKVKVLVDAVPDARFLVIVRNPAAQLTSIQRMMGQGRLQELAAALKTLPAEVARDPSLARYRPWIGDGDATKVLVAWWFLNYETLLSDLDACRAPALLVRHEELSAQPYEGSEKVFAFLGLTMTPAIEAYLRTSTAEEPRSTSPLDTFRESARHSQATIRDADRTIVARLERVAAGLPCAPALHDYFAGR